MSWSIGYDPHWQRDIGCGLYFCPDHLIANLFCERCDVSEPPFHPTADHPDWIHHKATDPSWARWREAQKKENRND